jgi:hypothetical protein
VTRPLSRHVIGQVVESLNRSRLSLFPAHLEGRKEDTLWSNGDRQSVELESGLFV